MIKKKTLIWIILVWVFLTVINYYSNLLTVIIIWLGMTFIFAIGSIIQIIKLFRELKKLTKLRILKVIVFLCLTILSFNNQMANGLIERVDWLVLKNKRNEIVQKVKEKKLNPNVSWNNWICELPFEFPIISNGGNDIGIERKQNEVTVTFWIFRNFFDSPSKTFIYTNNIIRMKEFEERIKNDPKNNWKISENWYRIYNE